MVITWTLEEECVELRYGTLCMLTALHRAETAVLGAWRGDGGTKEEEKEQFGGEREQGAGHQHHNLGEADAQHQIERQLHHLHHLWGKTNPKHVEKKENCPT